MYSRQLGWLEAREKHTLVIAEGLNPRGDGHSRSISSRACRKLTSETPRQSSSPMMRDVVARDLHVRRYARARDDKERGAAALTWSASRAHRSQVALNVANPGD